MMFLKSGEEYDIGLNRAILFGANDMHKIEDEVSKSLMEENLRMLAR